MNSRQRKSLEALFRDPPPRSMEWSDIEALLVALGATIVEGRGSRVRFVLNQAVATFHRPHPSKDAKPYQIQDARSFLEQAGIKP
jgi:predicted RNA binding protein YcfA (HicA-like mRNA interferase family)